VVSTLEAIKWKTSFISKFAFHIQLAPLRNGHLYTALRLLRRHKVLDALTRENQRSFKAMLRRLILATDMEKHTQMVTDFVAMATATITAAADDAESGDDDDDEGGGGTGAAALSSADTAAGVPVRDWVDPGLALCYVLHCADISNPARPFPAAKKWGEKISEEFYKQGDKERALGMRVLAFCNRTLAGAGAVAQNQGNFIDFVCQPTFEALSVVVPVAADLMLYHLKLNREEYRKQAADVD
jgi:cAMP-specific phosphodiesterase 4